MDVAHLRELLSLAPELRAAGVRRIRVGDAELELERDPLDVVDLAALDIEKPEQLDPNLCQLCQKRPPGKLQKGICRVCTLGAAGVTVD
jgi:hypothetical protein